MPDREGEIGSRLHHMFPRYMLDTFILLRREAAVSRWNFNLDGYIDLVLVKYGYIFEA